MRSRLAALVLVASALAAQPALGAPPDGDKGDPRVAARALAEHGYSLYQKGKYAEAIDSLEHAERLYHAPTIVVALARAYAALGKLVEARALYVRVRDEQLAADAPDAFKSAQREAPAEIEAFDRRIPVVTIFVRGGGGKGLRLRIDEAELREYRPDTPMSLNPGPHRLTVVPLGGVGVTRAVDLVDGARIAVDIELAGAAPVVVTVPVAAPPAPEPPKPWRLPAYLCFGIGGAFLALGVGATVYAGVKSAELQDACPSGRCRTPEHDSEISLGKAMNATGNIGLVLGGAGIVAGTVLMLVKPKPKEPSRASLLLGPGTVGVEGVF